MIRQFKINIPANEVESMRELFFELQSVQQCMAYAHTQEEREHWRGLWAEEQTLWNRELSRLLSLYGNLSLVDGSDIPEYNVKINFFAGQLYVNMFIEEEPNASVPTHSKDRGNVSP